MKTYFFNRQVLSVLVAVGGIMLVGVAHGAIPERPERISFKPLDFDPPSADEFRHALSNGVTVYMAPSQEFPLLTVSFSFKGGAYMEPPDRVSLGRMTGSLIRQGGTKTIPPKEFDEQIDFLAANVSVYVGDTFSGATINSLKSNFEESFGLFMDMLRHPGFDSERLRIAKDEAIERMKQRNDDADDILAREWSTLMWGEDHFESRVATAAMINSIAQDDLRAFHRRIFHPGNMIISVTGDFDPQQMLSMLESAISGWPIGDPVPDPPAPSDHFKPGLYHVEKDIPQGKIRIGHRGIERDHPDAIALSVMNDILGGGGFTSRLVKRIRSDEGLSYGVGSSFQNRVWYPGEFRVGTFSKNPTVALTIKIAMEEMEKIRTEPVSERELETSQNSFIQTFPRNFESKAGMLNIFVNDQWTNRDPNYWKNYRDAVRKITLKDVSRVAQQYMNPDNMAIMVVGKWDEIYRGDVDGRASMAEFFGGQAEHLPLRDPLTLEPLPAQQPGSQ